MARKLKQANDLEFTQTESDDSPTFESEQEFFDEGKKEGLKELDVIKIKQQYELLDGLKQDRSERKKYAFWVFMLICAWLFSDLIFVYLAGRQCLKISDAVQITMITTTTGSVIAIFLYVMVYLFKGTIPTKSSAKVSRSKGKRPKS